MLTSAANIEHWLPIMGKSQPVENGYADCFIQAHNKQSCTYESVQHPKAHQILVHHCTEDSSVAEIWLIG